MPDTISHITLYCALPEADQFRPVVRSAKARLRLAARRAYDSLRWALSHRFDHHWWDYFDTTDCNLGDIAIRQASLRNLRALFGPHVVIDEISWQHLTPEKIEQVNRNSDLLVISAGAYVHIDHAGECLPWFFEEVRRLSQIRCQIVSYGIGVSHKIRAIDGAQFPITPRSHQALGQFVSMLKLCGVRDERSRQILQPMAPAGRPVLYVPDPALTLQAPPSARPLPGFPRIGLNFALHGPHVEALQRAHFSDFAGLLGHIRRRHPDCRFYYFQHSDEERLLVRLFRSLGHSMEVISGTPDQLMPGYAAMDVHIAQMLHSCILAACAGTPTLNLAYDTKNIEFYKALGLERWCILPADYSPARFQQGFEDLLTGRAEVARQLAEARNAQLKIHASFLNELRNSVQPGAALPEFTLGQLD